MLLGLVRDARKHNEDRIGVFQLPNQLEARVTVTKQAQLNAPHLICTLKPTLVDCGGHAAPDQGKVGLQTYTCMGLLASQHVLKTDKQDVHDCI